MSKYCMEESPERSRWTIFLEWVEWLIDKVLRMRRLR